MSENPLSSSSSAPAESRHPTAPERALSHRPYFSVEYPGYVQDSSVPKAVASLGGQQSIDSAFSRGATKTDSLIELNLRPDNPFSHPVPGDVVSTDNILLKVVKRKRAPTAEDPSEAHFTVEAVGVIPKTVRFRSMADYQYQPDREDPIHKLRVGMQNLDTEAILRYRIPEEKEDYQVPAANRSGDGADMQVDHALIDPSLVSLSEAQALSSNAASSSMRSNLRLFPPTIFSRQSIPQNYNYKANPASIVTTVVDDDTGEEKKRLVNRMRWKGYGPTTILYTDTEVPTKPPQSATTKRPEMHQPTLAKLEELFKQRPVWTRVALFSQFSGPEAREIQNTKTLLSLVSYVFSDGPWRDTMVVFGYDPRKDPAARIYQRMYFRNLNHPIERVSVMSRRQDRTAENAQLRAANQWSLESEADRKLSHTFDGKTLTKDTASFQLCDITDPLLKGMIEDPSVVRETCHEKHGWYVAAPLERIKNILRHKFFALLEGYQATDEECLLIGNEKEEKTIPTTKSIKTSWSKHNRADRKSVV